MEPIAVICPEPYAPSFTVGGVTYTMSQGLALGRARYLDRLVTEALYSVNFIEHGKELAAIRDAMNKVNFVTAASGLQRLIEEYNLLGANRYRAAEICALYFNSETEDPTTYVFADQQAKIAAWGAVHRDFFLSWSRRLWTGGSSPYSADPPESPEPESQPSPPN